MTIYGFNDSSSILHDNPTVNNIYIDVNEEISIQAYDDIIENRDVIIDTNFYNDAWLLALHNQVEFLHGEIKERNNLINMLTLQNTEKTNEVEFLRNEIQEKTC